MRDANETRSRLEERASAEGDDAPRWVALRVGEARFGVDIERVREVMHPPEITRLPKAPPAVRGVVSIRGDVVPVVDLGLRLLGRAAGEGGRLVVVTHTPTDEPVGLLVDDVSGLIPGGARQIETAPKEVVASLPEAVVQGVVAGADGRAVTLLDLDRVLDLDVAHRAETS